MKNVLLSIALATGLSATVNAQRLPDATPQPVDLHLAGEHLERAGKMRTTALLTTVGLGLVGGMVASMDPDMMAPGLGLAGLGLLVGVGINLGANGHEKKAGRIMMGR